MTSTPTPQGREDGFSAATLEALLRYDEASTEDLALLEDQPAAAAVLQHLRDADAFLHNGSLRNAQPTSTVTSEQLFAYAHGELAPTEADVVAEHLTRTPREKEWVEALRNSPPPATLTWEELEEEASRQDHRSEHDSAEASNVLPGPGSRSVTRVAETDQAAAKGSFPQWLAWTPLAAAALILTMAISGTGQRSVLDGGLPDSPIMRSASTDALLFPRGRVIASTPDVRTYASNPLFEVTPVDGASQYGFELRRVTGQNAFAEGETVWESSATSHQASAPMLEPGKYTWTATATVQSIDRVLGSLSFTVVPARSVDRALFVRAAVGLPVTMPGILREDIRRLHASGFLTDARSKARALPPGEERDRYLGAR